jgi:hypothetical protein
LPEYKDKKEWQEIVWDAIQIDFYCKFMAFVAYELCARLPASARTASIQQTLFLCCFVGQYHHNSDNATLAV